MNSSPDGQETSALHSPEEVDMLLVVSSDTRVDHLRRVSLFSDCTDEELRRIADISNILVTPHGADIERRRLIDERFVVRWPGYAEI